MLYVFDSEMVWIHAFFENQFDDVFCVLCGIFFEVGYYVVYYVAICRLDTLIVNDLLYQVKILAFYCEIYGIPQFLAFYLNIKFFRVIAKEELGYVSVLILQGYHESSTVLILDSVYVYHFIMVDEV